MVLISRKSRETHDKDVARGYRDWAVFAWAPVWIDGSLIWLERYAVNQRYVNGAWVANGTQRYVGCCSNL